MGNDYFRFKEFRVQQSFAPMRVCTDACLFGAWIGREMQEENKANKNISVLDIGTGTGLLTLMVAQKNPTARFTAIELNSGAIADAKMNFENSGFKKNIKLIEGDINTFEAKEKFDFILSNPPFFEKDLKGPNAGRNSAMHRETLSLEQLALAIDKNISTDGKAAVLLTFGNKTFEAKMKELGWNAVKIISLKQSFRHTPLRKIILLEKNKTSGPITAEIIIKDKGENYSEAFIQLLKDYYLYL